MGNPENLRLRKLRACEYLNRDANCFYVLDYLRYGNPDNPQFILDLKNTYNSVSLPVLQAAKQTARDIIVRWTPEIMRRMNLSACSMVCVPRSKAFDTYTPNQMFLLCAVHEAAQLLAGHGVTNAAAAIRRTVSTRTTHLRADTERVMPGGRRERNTGDAPYPGITWRTCLIDPAAVRGRTVLLVDDIYTGGVHIDEDCIQALYNAGAENVVLFALSCTTPRKEYCSPWP